MRCRLISTRCLDGVVSVTCLEGIVTVEQGGRSVQLRKAEQVTYSRAGLQASLPVDARQVAAWQTGLLIFRDRPLASVVDEVNRYRAGKIIITNAGTEAPARQRHLPGRQARQFCRPGRTAVRRADHIAARRCGADELTKVERIDAARSISLTNQKIYSATPQNSFAGFAPA